MTPAEFIDEINRQLDISRTVMFSHDDAFSLMTQLNVLKNLQDARQDATIAQIAAMQTQRAEAADRAVKIAIDDVHKMNAINRDLTRALHSALALQDAMLNEIRRLAASGAGLHGVVPVQLTVAKNNFDREMKKLLGDEK